MRRVAQAFGGGAAAATVKGPNQCSRVFCLRAAGIMSSTSC